MKQIKLITVSAIAALFIGCGGSSGGGENTNSSNTQKTATFIDDVVAGVSYVNGKNHGKTDANGQFPYTSGLVEFFLGNVKLGEISSMPSDNRVFIQDVVGVQRSNTSNTNVVKIARLLQSLDANSSTDAIEISQTDFDKFAGDTASSNISDLNITTLLTSNGFSTSQIVTTEQAKKHIKNALKSFGEITDSDAPTLVSSNIQNNATDIALNESLTLTFSEGIPRSFLTSEYFTLKTSSDTLVSTTISKNANTITVSPTQDLSNDETYTLSVKSSLKDYAKNSFGNDHTISFSTLASGNTLNSLPNIVVAGGLTQSVVKGHSITIDPSASSDTEQSDLTYSWKLFNGTTQTNLAIKPTDISTTTTLDTSTLTTGNYVLKLKVYDTYPQSYSTQEIAISVTNQGKVPGNLTVQNNDFILQIDTEATDNNGTNDFMVKSSRNGGNFNVDCNNDGINEATGISDQYTCSYSSDGVYKLRVSGTYYHLGFSDGDPKKITKIIKWGDAKWKTMNQMFYNASNLTGIQTYAGVPDLSQTYTLESMFKGATKFNANIDSWDTSYVQSMSNLFNGAKSFNGNISSWDVSSVNTMYAMFKDSPFNQDIGSWDVSSVTNMYLMFFQSRVFNQDISSWDTSKVNTMGEMFYGASSFNQNIGSWDVRNVNDMYSMFRNATAFNQDISSWKIQNVTNLGYMFKNASTFNQDLSAWYQRKNKNLSVEYMFLSSGMSLLNQSTFLNGPNDAPIANAGADQNVFPGHTVTLDASASSDSDGSISSYSWSENSTVLSTNSSFSKNDFSTGTHILTLTITDDEGASATDTITIVIAPASLSM